MFALFLVIPQFCRVEILYRLKEMGVTGVYGPGASTEDIIRDVKLAVAGEVDTEIKYFKN